MKVKKVNQKPLNSKKKKSAIAKRKKRGLNKLTTEESFEQNFETDSDACVDDEDKNIDNKDNEEINSDSSEGNLDPVEHKKSLMKLRKKKELSKLTTEEFFKQNFEMDSDAYDSYDDDDDKNIDNKDNDQMDSDSSEGDLDPAEHKKSLMKLKDTDPEFYKYLKENDKNLLDFRVSDDEDDNSSIDGSDNRHVPNENLEVASDDSDFQPEETDGDSKKKITLQLLKTWQQKIQTDKSIVTIKCTVEAFHAALDSVAVLPDTTTEYKVEGSATFNAVMQLCIMYLPDAFKRFLNLDSESQEAHKSKRFGKIRWILKLYLSDLIKLLQSVASTSILTVLLKHLRQMLPYTRSFSSLTKPLLKILIKLWSTAEETVRVTAFLNILHIATSKESVLEKLVKNMYVKYVQNTKFVSPNTLPGINFMKHSLVEIYLLNHDISYNHAFLYIRQLAINLRNAITLKKRENFQAVYNWQYINSLRFWTDLITKSKEKSMLRSLLYPLVQIIVGTIKVIPTAQYYPLRFHCVEMLITISEKTGMFIPILPFLLEILDSYDFNKRHKAVTMKPIPLICILRMSKSQLVENGFKDSIIETVYRFILEDAANESHKIYFPDVYIPCIIQLKAFLKKCRVATYCKKIKQLLNMIEENRKYIEAERIKIPIDLKNTAEITNWENRVKTDGTEIAKFYASWIQIHKSQMLKLLTKNEEVLNVPARALKRQKLDERDAEDSEEESEFEFRLKGTESEGETKKPINKAKKHKKNKKRKTINNVEDEDLPKEDTDIVQDINSDDWG
ncbi:PREDICTED: nucleolar complex protein 2 homolog [Wasmannia auropunctata]|uniref:nucleolar complex protein 2 homolog n=1 Tax=Wasmannia auropunctata TaxID=64793 RepID=UPI0005F023BE|nr:PREDICTED: nucleolar complex protein 2 homolog [Wasmannia auropunctata]XP_011703949.1 PREDICTED: nucleolar complex protein 2 homolog [Wasmannia auropunctata]